MSTTLDPVRRINDQFGWQSTYECLWEWVQTCVWISLPINCNSPLVQEELEFNFADSLLEFDRETGRFAANLVDDEGSYYIVSISTPGYFVENYGCAKEEVARNIVFDVLELEYVASRIATDIYFWVNNVKQIFEDRTLRSKSENIVKK